MGIKIRKFLINLPLIFESARVKEFRINIVGLSNKVHEFDFQIGKAFFEKFGTSPAEDANLEVKILLDKHETFLDAEFRISGTVVLTCDRSLEPFEEHLDITSRILFKYADQTEEISEDIVHIHRDTASLDMSQYVYDIIGTSLPMKRLHPKFRDEEPEGEGKIIYQSGGSDEPQIDPRWEKLKNLK